MHSNLNPFTSFHRKQRTICGMRSPEGIADLRSRVDNRLAEETPVLLFGCPSRTPCGESRQDKEQNLQTSEVNGQHLKQQLRSGISPCFCRRHGNHAFAICVSEDQNKEDAHGLKCNLILQHSELPTVGKLPRNVLEIGMLILSFSYFGHLGDYIKAIQVWWLRMLRRHSSPTAKGV